MARADRAQAASLRLPSQIDRRQWRNGHAYRMFTLMLADIFTVDCAGVADVAAVVEMRIGVKNFAIHPRSADANAVVGARNRREITDDNHLTGVFIAAGKGKNRVGVIVDHQPFKTARIEIQLIQRRVVAIRMVEIAYQMLNTGVPAIRIVKQMPVKAGVEIPLAPLRKLAAHKQKFFTRIDRKSV